CFCMKSVFGFVGCIAIRWTQCPTSACGSGMYCECKPWLIGFQVLPPSSVRNAPAAEIAMKMRFGFFGSIRIECRHIPPAPGCHFGPVSCWRSPDNSLHDVPPSLLRCMICPHHARVCDA